MSELNRTMDKENHNNTNVVPQPYPLSQRRRVATVNCLHEGQRTCLPLQLAPCLVLKKTGGKENGTNEPFTMFAHENVRIIAPAKFLTQRLRHVHVTFSLWFGDSPVGTSSIV